MAAEVAPEPVVTAAPTLVPPPSDDALAIAERGVRIHWPPFLAPALVAQTGVGIVAPHDFALDRELWRWAPPDVTLHVTRTRAVPIPVTVAMAEAISETDRLQEAVLSLAPVRPHCVGYACTSGSCVRGVAGEQALCARMREAGAPEATSGSGALLHALEALGIHRLTVVTPYLENVTWRLHDFLAEAGHDVVSSAHLGLTGQIWLVPYATVADAVLDAVTADAEAVFVSCTNLTTYDVIDPLSDALGIPVLTANEVLMWDTLRVAGKHLVGPGSNLLP